MDKPLDKRRKVTWRLVASLLDPPDRDGDVTWIAELRVTGNFTGGRHPTVQFMVDRKSNGIDLKPIPGPNAPTPPFYIYTIGVYLRNSRPLANSPNRDVNLNVRRVFDEEGRYCARVPRSSGEFFGNYELDPEEEERVLGSPVQEGVWRAIITGNVYDAVHVNEAVWKSIAPYLLQMSEMPDMKKMNNLLPLPVEHWQVHTDVDFEEGLSSIIKKEEKLIKEARTYPLLSMPSPTVLPKRIIEHWEVHTDTTDREEE
jgi:hypothetical protein